MKKYDLVIMLACLAVMMLVIPATLVFAHDQEPTLVDGQVVCVDPTPTPGPTATPTPVPPTSIEQTFTDKLLGFQHYRDGESIVRFQGQGYDAYGARAYIVTNDLLPALTSPDAYIWGVTVGVSLSDVPADTVAGRILTVESARP